MAIKFYHIYTAYAIMKNVLKQLRQKKVMKRVLWGLAIVIIPAFVLWGGAGLMEGRRYAGVIYGKKISYEEYGESYTAARNLAILTHGSKFNEMRSSLDLEGSAWDRLIMLKEAKRKGIKVTDEEVIARIASLPVFQTKEGYFDGRTYAMILGNILRTTPRDFEEEVRQSLMIERLLMAVFRDVGEPPEEEIARAMELAPETKADGEGAEEETPEQKRERARNAVLITKRMDLYGTWRDELYKRANLKSYVEKPEEVPAEEAPSEEPPAEASSVEEKPAAEITEDAAPATETPATDNLQPAE